MLRYEELDIVLKIKKLSLKWKIFGYLLGLAALLLAVLWLCQTVYLESFYTYIKEKDMESAVEQLKEAVEEEDYESAVYEIARANELSIKIVNQDGDEWLSEQFFPVSAIDKLTKEQLVMYFEEVREKNGQIEFRSGDGMTPAQIQEDIQKKPMPQNIPPDKQNEKGRPIEEHLQNFGRGGQESMVSAQMIEIEDESYLMLVAIQLTPVDATVQTLQVQLIYISIIIIMLALILAFIISRSVSSSIINVNQSAHELAKGNFDVSFEGRDYKEIAELSDTLNYATKELAKSENYQRELIANVSHDLRTPLTMIIAYSEVMRDLPGENSPENIQVVIEEAQRLTNLVNDMLDISKLQSGVLEVEKKRYNLTESINRVLERYSKLKEQERYQIQFIADCSVYVCADEYKIFQVLYNLINNAINYTGEDKKVTVEQIVKKDKVRIEVRDTGAGIPDEELENVWERYYKIDKVHKRAVKGTGLGLSICKNILKLHNAEYGVESKEMQGSIFWFELDIC